MIVLQEKILTLISKEVDILRIVGRLAGATATKRQHRGAAFLRASAAEYRVLGG